MMNRRSVLKQIPVIAAATTSLTSSPTLETGATTTSSSASSTIPLKSNNNNHNNMNNNNHNQKIGVIWDSIRSRALPATPKCFNSIIHSEIIGGFLSLEKTRGLIFVSERHDDFQHHLIQLKIIQSVRKAIAQRQQQQQQEDNKNNFNGQLAIGMECFLRDHQKYLDKFIDSGRKNDGNNQQQPYYTINDLHRDTNWSINWGYDIMHYAPVLLFAQQKGIRLIGLHPNNNLVDQVETNGIKSILLEHGDGSIIDDVHIDETSYHYKRFKKSTLPSLQESLLCDGAIGTILKRKYEVLCFREEYMAESIARYQQQHGSNGSSSWMIVLAGENHILHRDGVPLRALRRTSSSSSSSQEEGRRNHQQQYYSQNQSTTKGKEPHVQNRGFFTVIPRTTKFPLIVAKEVPSISNGADYVWFVERDPNEIFDEQSVNNATPLFNTPKPTSPRSYNMA